MFSLFFIDFIRCLKLAEIYRIIDTKNISNINSFHIRNSVRNFPSRPSLNVINVCKKNCNKSQITNILHNKINRSLSDFERIDHRRVESFFIIIRKRPKRIQIFCLIFYFYISHFFDYINCQNMIIIAVTVRIV